MCAKHNTRLFLCFSNSLGGELRSFFPSLISVSVISQAGIPPHINVFTEHRFYTFVACLNFLFKNPGHIADKNNPHYFFLIALRNKKYKHFSDLFQNILNSRIMFIDINTHRSSTLEIWDKQVPLCSRLGNKKEFQHTFCHKTLESLKLELQNSF